MASEEGFDPFAWFKRCIGRCLHSQMLSVIARLSPDARAQSRALRQWQGVLAARKEAKARMERAYAKMSPEGRAKGKCLNVWRDEVRERKRRMNAIKTALARMTPEGRAKYAGMCAFRGRAPTWTLPTKSQIAAMSVPPSVAGTKDGFWLVHTAHRARTSTLGMPFIQRGIYRFGFKIVGSAVGLVVGVADATDRYPTSPLEPLAWGLHLSHGCLYTKRAGSEKGLLSTKQLTNQVSTKTAKELNPVAEEEEGVPSDGPKVMEVEVEVDMDRRRIAFGLSGGPMVRAPVKLSGCVRPWCFMWEEGDAVMLDARPVQGRSSMIATRSWIQPDSATKVAPVPLRASAPVMREDLPPAAGKKIASHAVTGDYLPAYAYGVLSGPIGTRLLEPPGTAPGTTPGTAPAWDPTASVASSVKSSSIHPAWPLASPGSAIRAVALSARHAIGYSPDGRRIQGTPQKIIEAATAMDGAIVANLGLPPEDTPLQRRKPPASSSAMSSAIVYAVSSPKSTASSAIKYALLSKATGTKHTAMRSGLTPAKSAQLRLAEAAREKTARAMGLNLSSLVALSDNPSGTLALPPTTPGRNSPRSPRSAMSGSGTHMWDVVRYVSGVYSDTFRQI